MNNINYSTPNGTLLPCEGPRAASITLDFTNTQNIAIDFSQQVALNQISMVQGIYVDNSNNSQALTVLVNGSNQRIVAPGGQQGFFPVLAPNPPKFVFSTSGGVIVNVFLLNYPVSPLAWETVASSGGTSNVNVETFAVPPLLELSNGALVNQKLIDSVKTGSLTASGQSPAILTATFTVSAINLQLSPNATQAVAGPFKVVVKSPIAGNLFTAEFYVPSAAPTISSAVAGPSISTPPGWGNYNNDGLDPDTLVIVLPAALTAGELTYNIAYNSASN